MYLVIWNSFSNCLDQISPLMNIHTNKHIVPLIFTLVVLKCEKKSTHLNYQLTWPVLKWRNMCSAYKFWILILICKNDVNLVAIITYYIFFFCKITHNILAADPLLGSIIFANMIFFFFWLNPVRGCYFVMYKETKPLIKANFLIYAIDFNKANKYTFPP